MTEQLDTTPLYARSPATYDEQIDNLRKMRKPRIPDLDDTIGTDWTVDEYDVARMDGAVANEIARIAGY